MLIANPIYDVVFKYLMEDSKVAKLLLSAIIGAQKLWTKGMKTAEIADLLGVAVNEVKEISKLFFC